jgi:hypothetical protein
MPILLLLPANLLHMCVRVPLICAAQLIPFNQFEINMCIVLFTSATSLQLRCPPDCVPLIRIWPRVFFL